MKDTAYIVLKHIGLSPLDIRCYAALCTSKEARTSAELYAALGPNVTRRSVYRSLQRLEAWGFVKSLRIICSRDYCALPLAQALAAKHAHERKLLEPLLVHQDEVLCRVRATPLRTADQP